MCWVSSGDKTAENTRINVHHLHLSLRTVHCICWQSNDRLFLDTMTSNIYTLMVNCRELELTISVRI